MDLGYKTLRTIPIDSLPYPHPSSLELVLYLLTSLLDTWPNTPINTISLLVFFPYVLILPFHTGQN